MTIGDDAVQRLISHSCCIFLTAVASRLYFKGSREIKTSLGSDVLGCESLCHNAARIDSTNQLKWIKRNYTLPSKHTSVA